MMGRWKIRKLKKELNGRKNSTQSKKARLYSIYPPEGGWKGGLPEQNGYKHRG